MREVNLRSVDLNLLTVLQALLEERHVTKAAEKLYMSQSAVSRALQRLRLVFNDPLLIKSADGYILSNRAIELATELSIVLQTVTRLIQEPDFDPISSKGVLRFAGIDLSAWIDMPALTAEILEQAPQLKIEVSSSQADYFEKLMKGHVDFMVSGPILEDRREDIRSTKLGSSNMGIVMGKNNPLSEQEITLTKYLSAQHGYVAITGKGSALSDQHLLILRKKRNVVLKLSDFKSVVDYCERTNVIFTLPLQLIKSSLIGSDVIIKSLPDELYIPAIEFNLYWHVRFHNDPLHKWAKDKILKYSLF